MKTKAYFPISNSRIQAFECPYYFFNEYLLGDSNKYEHYEPNKPLPLRIGQFAHRVIELYTKRLVQTGQESDIETLNYVLNAEWQGNHYIPEAEYEEIERMLYTFAERNTIDPNYTLDAELEIALNWNLQQAGWLDDDVWIRMKLDRVDVYGKTAKITDYKTGFYIPSETETKKNLQGKLYAWGLHVLNPYLDEFEVEFSYIRWGVKRTVSYKIADIEDIEKRLRVFTQRIMSRISNPHDGWPAIINDNTCYICNHQCPLLDMGISFIKTEQDAVDAGRKILALEAEAKELTKKLRNWCGIGGFADVGVGTFRQQLSQRVKVSKIDQLAEICKKHNTDPSAFIKTVIDSNAIKDLPDGKLKSELVSEGTRFGFLARDKKAVELRPQEETKAEEF